MRKIFPQLPPVVVLTSMDGGSTRLYATKVGKADAFVTKAQLLDEGQGLLAQVRRLVAPR